MKLAVNIDRERRIALGLQAALSSRNLGEQIAFLIDQEEKRLTTRLTAMQSNPTAETAS
jgi:hypothetical protein